MILRGITQESTKHKPERSMRFAACSFFETFGGCSADQKVYDTRDRINVYDIPGQQVSFCFYRGTIGKRVLANYSSFLIKTGVLSQYVVPVPHSVTYRVAAANNRSRYSLETQMPCLSKYIDEE